MEISSTRGLTELGIIEDPNFLHQWHLSSIDTSSLTSATLGETLQKYSFSNDPNFNPKTSMETSPTGIERPAKQLKNNSWNHNKSPQTSETQFDSCSNLLSFVDLNYTSQLGLVKPKVEMVCPKMDYTTPADMLISQGTLENQNYVFKTCHEAKKTGTRPKLSQHHDHIIAERKRREKLSQRFIALSALVPGLKKMDKASVLGDAIKYLKQMQEKVSALEEEQKRKKTVESVVIVKKSQISNDAEDCSSDAAGGTFDEALPEIEARFCERNVLIRVHCEKNKGVVEKTISEIEKLHLKVINTSALTFGSFALDITIIAQMDTEFCMKVKDLVRNLRSAYSSFM
ncbi:transcription factor bHLH25-like [Gastrolobium bilobum]|uniref:transcription factor bHLH25-like n=1 Tax=Gastrolobium bilobum TaxID=150636 RepID=UPI002AB00B00|nr:transcription factor bHLH25-like [Gastrolobium bilobum]XP_061370125.1 transcription factor bHLH25-like [Gastrolobium bilobum]